MSTADLLAGVGKPGWIFWALVVGCALLVGGIVVGGGALNEMHQVEPTPVPRRSLRREVACAVVMLVVAAATLVSTWHVDATYNHRAQVTVARYVHDHNQLVALSPIDLSDRGAWFDALDSTGSPVHVRMDWSAMKAQPVDPTQTNSLSTPTVTVTR